MREIKFRAWDKFTTTMVGVAILDFGVAGAECAVDFFGFNGDLKSEWDLEQYTGIKDVNGTEIYENDIIQTHAMIPGDEKYVDAVPTGVIKYDEGAYWIDNVHSAIRLFQESIQIEVIGNIHENPELLEETK